MYETSTESPLILRAEKSLGLVNGTPDYCPVAGFVAPDVRAITQKYSTDGRLYAYALPTVLRIFQAEGAQLLQELPLPNIVDFSFSPRGTYISTWKRPGVFPDLYKNLRVFSVSTGVELISFNEKSQEGWDLQYTISESHAIRLVSSEIQVFRPAEWSKGIVDKLKVEGSSLVSLSPGVNPTIAVFVAETKQAAASIRIHSLAALSSPPTCLRMLFGAYRVEMKWNTLGTQVLLSTRTKVDNSNNSKSYYSKDGIYLLSAAENFGCRVTLHKEGPIHDFAWSPNSQEFGDIYGYLPAKTVLIDQRVQTLHDFGISTNDFISFNPQGRLIALADLTCFGNLAGRIEIFDRRTLSNVCTIDAPNTSYCEWSPDGRFLLTATLSPRLRVDNGIKIWHCSGALVHIQLTEELYQTSWRPTPVDHHPPFGATIPPAPAPSESVQNLAAVQKPVPSKPSKSVQNLAPITPKPTAPESTLLDGAGSAAIPYTIPVELTNRLASLDTNLTAISTSLASLNTNVARVAAAFERLVSVMPNPGGDGR